jgi:hypothetical protein
MTYESKRKPRVKQAEALKVIEGKKNFALLMEMRTGKTKVIVDDWGKMVEEDKVIDLLVIAPGGAYIPWADAIRIDLPDHLMRQTRIFTWVSGKANNKSVKRELDSFLAHKGPRILIINIEAISSVKKAQELCVKFLRQQPGGNMTTIDESVCVKNQDSSCGWFCVEVLAPLSTYKRILSGLISPRSPLDIYYQYKFLDPDILGYEKFTAFRARYAKVNQVCMLPNQVIRGKFKGLVGLMPKMTDAYIDMKISAVDPEFNLKQNRGVKIKFLEAAIDGMPRNQMIEAIPRLGGYVQSVPTIDGYQNVEELHDKISPHSFRVRLDECYDMPKSDYSFYDVEMTKEQEKIYHDLKEFATAELDHDTHVTAGHVVTQMLRLHQVLCGHTKDDDKDIHPIKEKRTDAILKILDGYGGKAVIWCSYDYNIRNLSEAIEKEFGEGSVARFWGGNLKTREEEEVAFKNNPRCRFQVATPDAGGKGRAWDVADLTIYHSSRNNLDHRAQSEDRVKADGKMRTNAYIDLRVKGTVEERIIEALRKKIDLSTVINGDNWREWLI